MIQYPAFKPNDIKKESGVVIDELYDIEDNPEELIFDKFEENIYAGNSLALPVIGTEKNIRGFTRLDLFNFIERKYGFNNLTIAASGNIEHGELVRLAQKYLTRDLGKKIIRRKIVSPIDHKRCSGKQRDSTGSCYCWKGKLWL